MGLLVPTSLVLDLFGTGISDDSSFLHQELLPGVRLGGGPQGGSCAIRLILVEGHKPFFLRGELNRIS